MAAAVHMAVGVAAVASALLAAGGTVSWWWLIPAVVVVGGWTSVYVVVAWTRGLRAWLISVDLLLASALCFAIGKLLPASAVPGTLSWVINIASVTVVSAQLAGIPAVSVPGGFLVAASIVAGSRLTHSADGGIPAAIVVAAQTVIAAAVMVVALRTERIAVGAFADLEKAQAAAALASARREDERAQLRLVHNGPLTMLTMALHASAGQPSAVLRRRAAATLDALPRLVAGPSIYNGEVRLDEQLAQAVVWYDPPLQIVANWPMCSVPEGIADAFTGAVAEALENVVRYAGTQRATVELRDEEGVVRVTVTDEGRGFDPIKQAGAGFGLREDLVGRMAAVSGTAAVLSTPGAGTMVKLEWRRG